jgi:hypothetical protein
VWYSIFVQLPSQSMQQATAHPEQMLCAYDAGIYGDRQAKKMARRVGREYIRSRGPGQPRLVKTPLEPYSADELAEIEQAVERGLVPPGMTLEASQQLADALGELAHDERSAEMHAASNRDIDYWPTLDLDAVWSELTSNLHELFAQRGTTQLYFDTRAVKRIVALEVLNMARFIRPELTDDFDRLLEMGNRADLNEDRNSTLHRELDAILTRNHLGQIVDTMVAGLSAEE